MSASETEALTWGALRSYYEHRKPSTYILPLPDRDLIYVKNPKAASSTLVVWLDRLHTGDYSSDLRRMHREHHLPRIEEVGRRQVLKMLSGSAYRFSFVRHPLRRFESVYWDKLVNSRQWRVRAATALGLPVDPDRPVTFEQFLGAVEQQDPVAEMDPHWRPQHVNLLHPLVSYDHIGKLETFVTDFERICDEAGLPQVPVEARSVSPRKSKESVYDGRPDLVRRVETLYARDFELYGY